MASYTEISASITGVAQYHKSLNSGGGWGSVVTSGIFDAHDLGKHYDMSGTHMVDSHTYEVSYRVHVDAGQKNLSAVVFKAKLKNGDTSRSVAVYARIYQNSPTGDSIGGSTSYTLSAGGTATVSLVVDIYKSDQTSGSQDVFINFTTNGGQVKGSVTAVEAKARVVVPDLSLLVSPSSVKAGETITASIGGRYGRTLYLTLSANGKELVDPISVTADTKSIATKVSWFDTAGVSDNEMEVRASINDSQDGRADSDDFTLVRPTPISVTAVSPKSTTIDGGQNITFSWTNSGGDGTQASASLQYSRDYATWYSLGSVTGTATTFTKDAGFFKKNGTVYWRVRVKSTYGVWSDYAWTSFTSTITAPTVTLTSPASGNIDISTAIQFKWTLTKGSGSITGTQMETSSDNGTTWVSRVDSTSSVTKFNATAGMFPTGKVLWRVRAKDEYAGWSAWQQSNITITAVLPVVTLTAPTSGTKDGGTAVAFNWTITQGSGNITGTQLYYTTDDGVNWSKLVSSSESVVTYTAAAGKFPAGTLKWRVRAKDQYTGWTSWQTATITVSYSAPTVTLTSPTSGSFDLGTAIKFVWTIAKGSGSISGTQMETSSDDGVTWVNRLDSTKSSTSFTASAGTFTTGSLKWRVRAKDQYTQSGQSGWGEWKQATITITKTLPVVTLVSPTSGTREGGADINFVWSLANGSGTITSVGFYTSEDDGVTWTKRLGKTGTPTSYTVKAATLAPGSLKWRVRAKDSLAGMSAWATASITIRYSATSYVVPLNSPTGGSINASGSTTFSATLKSNGTPYQPFTMSAATFYWRSNSADPYTSVQMTPNGANASVTISGGTFPIGAVQWYISATDNAGETTETAVYTVSTLASDIDAQPVSPVNTVEVSNDEITFEWRYASTTGEPQNGAELEYSTEGAVWTQFAAVEGTATSVVVPPNTFHSGTVFWRVRSFNSNGDAGPWSTQAQFVAYGAPDAPYVSVDAVPFATIRWQGTNQTSFEIEVDGKKYGPYLGEEKAYTLYDYLEDGSHSARVRILGDAGLWSLWGETQFDVTNVPTTTLTLRARTDVDTELMWVGGSGNYYVYRDRTLIARTNGQSFTDRVALGVHDYRVIERLASGNYNSSAVVTRTMEVECMHIAALDGGEWLEILHTLKNSSNPEYSYSALSEFDHVDSSEFPVVSVGPYLDENASYSAVFLYTEQIEHQRFRSLFRKPVILKTSDGVVMIGYLNAWERKPKMSRGKVYYNAYTFQLQRIGWEDFIDDTQ